jgi:hypothetical protein
MWKKKLVLWPFITFFALCAGHSQPGVKPPYRYEDSHARHDSNPALRHFIDLQIPTELTIKRTDNTLESCFSSFAHTNATVGYAMITGWKIQQYIVHDNTNQEFVTFGVSGSNLGGETNSFNLALTLAATSKENNYLEEHVTFYETDIPLDSNWPAEWGRYYKVLWAQTFRVPIE